MNKVREKIEGITESQWPEFVKEHIIPRTDRFKVWAFYGNLGAGKTTLIKEICAQCGAEKDTVNSPTFALVNEYAGNKGTVFHFDFYRLESEEEAYDLGYEDYFYSGSLCFVEWPERVASLLPDDAVKVIIETTAPDMRTVKIECNE